MKSVGLLFQITGLGGESIMTYDKPLICQLVVEIGRDSEHVDVFSDVWILV